VSSESESSPRKRFSVFRIVLGIVGVALILQGAGVIIRDRSVYFPYVFQRGDFVRTTGKITEVADGHVDYEFLKGTGSRERSTDNYEVGEAIEINFLKDNPKISYLRDEEPLFIEIFLEIISTLLGLGLIYRAIPKQKGLPADDAL
jgi:hypothetical protein